MLLGVLYVLASPWVLLSGIGSAMTEGGNPLSVGELLGWVVVPAAVAIAALGFSIRARAQGTHLSPDDVAAIRGGWTARSLLLSVVGAVLMAVPWACMLGLALRDGLR
ncbi:hypothetical protein [Demequina mangrovi]|uniref:hypothetical protein n=1 Tax=Demequina mangrovi TaxID=1043493 RepID=UPI000AD8D22A|nr:hypothetical protein [Demequina mangrovi]